MGEEGESRWYEKAGEKLPRKGDFLWAGRLARLGKEKRGTENQKEVILKGGRVHREEWP